jgi:tetratricopeptide (TPR) repeat protein
MKKIVLAMLLVAAVTAVAQTPSTPAQAAPAQTAPAQTAPAQAAPAPAASAPAQPAPQKKEIKDPAEYNAYVGAVQQSDAAAKVSGLEAFVTQYPNSVMKEDALEALMTAYQQAGNQAKMIDTAQKVLQVNPCNLRALAVVAFTKQAMATGPNAQQNLADAGQAGEKGLQCLPTAAKPEGTTPAEWDKLKSTTMGIFNNSAGMSAYAAKDYAKAEQFLHAAVEADPANLTEVYYLALADLQPGPAEKDVEGLFFVARAANLQTSAQGKDQIVKFGKSKYVKYHGSDEGWNDLLAQTATTTLPPANFTIAKYVPPTPAEQAAALIKTKKIEEMSFAEWQMVLSEGTPEDAEKVWSALKGKPLQMAAQVISIEPPSKIDVKGKSVDAPTKLQLAGSSDDIDAKRADIDLTMTAAIGPKDMPKEAADFQFQGTPVSYVAKPFVMTMGEGALLVAAKPKPKPTIRKKPAQ